MLFYKFRNIITPKVSFTSLFFYRFFSPLYSHGLHEEEVRWKKELWYATADRQMPHYTKVTDGAYMKEFFGRNHYRQKLVTEVGYGLSMVAMVAMLGLSIILSTL